MEVMKQRNPILYFMTKPCDVPIKKKRIYKTKRNPFGNDNSFKITYKRVVISFD